MLTTDRGEMTLPAAAGAAAENVAAVADVGLQQLAAAYACASYLSFAAIASRSS
jgi:hypothetical protein